MITLVTARVREVNTAKAENLVTVCVDRMETGKRTPKEAVSFRKRSKHEKMPLRCL